MFKKRMTWLLTTVLTATVLAGSCATTMACSNKILMGYYAYWNSDYKANKIPYSKLTHICHAFVRPNADGSLYVPSGFTEPGLIWRAHSHHKKVLLSVGGADPVATQNFKIIANSSTLRTTFLNNLKAFVQAQGYDGVDIDWEFPADATDRTNYSLLMQALRPEFDLITIAVNGTDYFSQWIDFYTVKFYVDYVNVMAYDMHGPWSNHAGENAPLYQGGDPDPISVQTMANYIEYTRGVPRDQILMGMPSFGYQYPNAENMYDSNVTGAFAMTYKEISPLIGNDWTALWDWGSSVPYLKYDPDAGVISYDDPTSISLKVEYALGYRGYAGVFIWELSQDYVSGSQPLVNAAYTTCQNY